MDCSLRLAASLGFGGLDIFAQRGDLRFSLVELLGVALQQGFFFRRTAQGLHVFAQAVLIFHDAVDIFLAIGDFQLQFGEGKHAYTKICPELTRLRDWLLTLSSQDAEQRFRVVSTRRPKRD